MAVAKNQIDELSEVIASYMDDRPKRIDLYFDLLNTQAARANRSFRATIERLLASEDRS